MWSSPLRWVKLLWHIPTNSILSSLRPIKGRTPLPLCQFCCPWDAKADLLDSWRSRLPPLTALRQIAASICSARTLTLWPVQVSHYWPPGIYFPSEGIYQKGIILCHSLFRRKWASQSISILLPQRIKELYSYNFIMKIYSRTKKISSWVGPKKGGKLQNKLLHA